MLALPVYLCAENVVDESAKIQMTIRDGKPVLTDAAPNAPVKVAEAVTVSEARLLDDQMPGPIQALVHKISRTHGIDPQLVAAVMKVESNYDRWARSSKGALGLMQLIPSTGARFGVRDFFDPAQNIEGGVRYLRFLSDKFGPTNLNLVLAAYNAGENLVERLGTVPPIPETRAYVRKIRTIYKPGDGPSLVSDSDGDPVVVESAPEPKPTIYKFVDERGVLHFSNMGPPH